MTTLRRIAGALFLLVIAASPAAAVERILQFISDADVRRNGDILVTETIRLQAEGREIRHGILRDFPTRYTARNGLKVEVGFSVQSVTRDGNAEVYGLENLSNGVRVRIGSADTTLSTGQHEYVIHYRTQRQIGFFDNYDELYWNATGTGWTFPINVAEARITLPDKVAFTQTAFYTGPQGAAGQNATIVQQEPGHIVFRTTRALPARSGLTVAAAWQKGVVLPPTGTQQLGYWMQDNPAVAVAGVGLVLILAYYIFAWRVVGRDPPTGTIIPLFGPPDGMSAAAVRYIKNMGFDQRCFTAAIVDLGVRGHLKLTKEAKNTILERRDSDKPLPPPEQAMKSRLFLGERTELFLDQSNYQTLGNGRTALQAGLAKAYLGTLFSNNFRWSGFGLLLVFLFVVALSILIAISHGGNAVPGLVIGLLAPLIPIMAGGGMIATGTARYSGGAKLSIGGWVLLILSVAGGLALSVYNMSGWLDLVPAVVAYIVAPLSGFGFTWLQAPSAAGRAAMDKIDGFQQYLGVAEEDRLNAMNPPEKTPELFERFLPYAIALDVENRWAARFASVLAAAGTAAVASAWYSGNQNWSSDPVGFANQLGGSLDQTIASAATPPGSSGGSSGSSGSSGGGFSGGGGGGGGGSGW